MKVTTGLEDKFPSQLFLFQVFIILASVALAAADNAPRYGAPAYKAPASYDEPAVYQYQYAVNDDYSGSNFQANEGRDGYSTSGSYSVALPDGRTQTVNYNVADAYSGYVADVTYSGQAQYAAAPTYKATPVYKATPAYHA